MTSNSRYAPIAGALLADQGRSREIVAMTSVRCTHQWKFAVDLLRSLALRWRPSIGYREERPC